MLFDVFRRKSCSGDLDWRSAATPEAVETPADIVVLIPLPRMPPSLSLSPSLGLMRQLALVISSFIFHHRVRPMLEFCAAFWCGVML